MLVVPVVVVVVAVIVRVFVCVGVCVRAAVFVCVCLFSRLCFESAFYFILYTIQNHVGKIKSRTDHVPVRDFSFPT